MKLDNQSFYDSDAATYDHRWSTSGGKYTDFTQRHILRSLCASWQGKQVVEVGCGTGRFSLELAKVGAKLVLVDLSLEMLERTRHRLNEGGYGSSVRAYLNESVYHLSFPTNTFDCLLSFNVFGHLENAEAALRECTRVLRPGGIMLINYPNLWSYYWPAARHINRRSAAIGQAVYSRWFSPHYVDYLAGQAGIKVVERVGQVHVPRGIEDKRFVLLSPVIEGMDRLSRKGLFRRAAPVQYLLCIKQ